MREAERERGVQVLAIDMQGITKRFPGMVANDSVDLQVEQGEIHSLLGENGAGKTTLMKVLFGFYKPEEGTLRIHGEAVQEQTPGKAFAQGIGMVHQHFMLINNLTVWENVVLGSEMGKGVIDAKANRDQVRKLSELYQFDLDVDAKIRDLSVGMKQRVEIMKTLYRGAKIIILDEPTAVLTPIEASQLLDTLLQLQKQGKTIIFITHKLHETMAISNHITVLRKGRSVAKFVTAETSEEELAAVMVGRQVDLSLKKEPVKRGKTVFSIRDVRLLPNAPGRVSLDIHAGEIVGIAGVEGNGQQQLEEMIMGLTPCREGRMLYLDQDITRESVKKRVKMKIGYIPSDRFKQAILPSFSLSDNYLLGNQFRDRFVSRGLIRHKELVDRTKEAMQQYDVRAVDENQTIGSLSGGNQQKLVLSREVRKDPDFVLACQPVRGLDIGAIHFIHKVLLDLKKEGKAILLISAELTDIFQLSDRIGVLHKGELMSLDRAEAFDHQTIGLYMAGKRGSISHDE